MISPSDGQKFYKTKFNRNLFTVKDGKLYSVHAGFTIEMGLISKTSLDGMIEISEEDVVIFLLSGKHGK